MFRRHLSAGLHETAAWSIQAATTGTHVYICFLDKCCVKLCICLIFTKIGVGDQDGVLQVFAIKKEDTQIQFKTLPTDKITTIQLGGATGPGLNADFCKILNYWFC